MLRSHVFIILFTHIYKINFPGFRKCIKIIIFLLFSESQ
jgi:hypothetical protein